MEKKTFILFLTPLLITASAFAETIILKSGKTVEGKIVEKAEKYIKIDFKGVPLTYYLNEIESITGSLEESTPPIFKSIIFEDYKWETPFEEIKKQVIEIKKKKDIMHTIYNIEYPDKIFNENCTIDLQVQPYFDNALHDVNIECKNSVCSNLLKGLTDKYGPPQKTSTNGKFFVWGYLLPSLDYDSVCLDCTQSSTNYLHYSSPGYGDVYRDVSRHEPLPKPTEEQITCSKLEKCDCLREISKRIKPGVTTEKDIIKWFGKLGFFREEREDKYVDSESHMRKLPANQRMLGYSTFQESGRVQECCALATLIDKSTAVVVDYFVSQNFNEMGERDDKKVK